MQKGMTKLTDEGKAETVSIKARVRSNKPRSMLIPR